MTSVDPAQQLAAWLRKRRESELLPEPPSELEADVVEAIYALQPHRAPAPRVTLDDILSGVEAGPFQGHFSDEEDTQPPEDDETTMLGSLVGMTGPYDLSGPDQRDAPDPVLLPEDHLEDSLPPVAFDATAFNASISSDRTQLDTPAAEALKDWLDGPLGTEPTDAVDADVAEAIYALRPERAPAPRVDLDDVFRAVEDGPFARGGAVVDLPVRLDSSSVPAVALDTTEDDDQPDTNVVSLADERRRRPWWAATGIGAVAVAALALIFAVPSMTMLRSPNDMAEAPMVEAPMAEREELRAGPSARKGTLDGQIAGQTTSTASSLDEAFAASEPAPAAKAVASASVEAAPSFDTARPHAEPPGMSGQRSASGGAMSSGAAARDDLEGSAYGWDQGAPPEEEAESLELDPPAPATVAAAADQISTELESASRGAPSRSRAGEGGLAPQKARALKQKKELKDTPDADADAAPGAALEPLDDYAEEATGSADYFDEEAEDDSDLSNTGGLLNTGSGLAVGNNSRSVDLQSLRTQAVRSSASPSRSSLGSLYAEVRAADEAAAKALSDGDITGAVRALDALMAHADPNVVMDTAYAIGDLLRNNGRQDLALAYVARGLGVAGGSDSQRGRLLGLRGQILESRGDRTGARRAYERAGNAY